MPRHDFDEIIDRRGTDSAKWQAVPEGVLPMWVADTDFSAPKPLLLALEKRLKHGIFGYAALQDKDFRLAVAHWMRSRFDWRVEADWVAFSPSVVISLILGIKAFSNPGDSVLFFSPSYPPFFRIPEQHKRKVLTSSLLPAKQGYLIDFDDLEEKMARPETRLFMLCNPHNPTGKVFARDELLRIGKLCLKHGLFVLSDEIHCDFVFPGKKHLPLPLLSEELATNCLVTINPSKTFNIADLHSSAVICPKPEHLKRFVLERDALALHDSSLGRLALTVAYDECAWYADQIAAYVMANAAYAVSFINAHVPGIKAFMPESTFLLWLDCRELGLEQEALQDFFLHKARVLPGNGTDFGPEGQGFMRLNLGCPRSLLSEALARIQRAVAQ
ncbi:pyridoxal phosphate-dependent aminotransferase [Desulfovibrio sp. OttesenSCG-928-M14]|nr:pyridoxal phosphate-dependent aminotransferase [Desulfovibrio sp. OttesenSCG-928-M14]